LDVIDGPSLGLFDRSIPHNSDVAFESSSVLFGLTTLLKSSWRGLSELERDRALTALIIGAAALRTALEPRTERLDGPTADDVRAALDTQNIAIHLQPIVRIETREVVGFEALSRFPEWPPDRWFHEAWEIGVGLDFELLAVRCALHSFAVLPADVFLSINVAPNTLVSNDLLRMIKRTDQRRLVLEITEHEPIDEYELYRSQIPELRKGGIRIAIDDLGAGHTSLLHLIRLEPDFIKLDRELIQGCNTDVVVRSLMTCIATFARESGIWVIAEGVELAEEAAALTSCGIEFAQGFYFD
jgi:EAL domain-containing protein (putative c-di-GMP-specific phosphodiesterase class I)